MSTDYDQEYADYLERFERLVGDIKTGQYGRYKGRLVRKYDREELEAKLEQYVELGERFVEMMNSGDTIDDLLAVDLRAAEAELVLEESRYLPDFGKR